jgi:hypothetical protein
MSVDFQDIIIEELKSLNRKVERLEDKIFSLQIKFSVGIIGTLISVIIALVRFV